MAPPYDEETKELLLQMIAQGDADLLTDAYYKDLVFGTGGLRGLMGIGSNRINKYTLGKATQGFSAYLKNQFPDEQIKVVIGFDSRTNSQLFAQQVASVFSGNGFKVYIFEDLRPTPLLSFAIRHLHCHAGVMLTASHNPKEYNGYKAYWRDGGQLVAPHDTGVMDAIHAIAGPQEIQWDPKGQNTEIIGKAVDEAYLSKMLQLGKRPDVVRAQRDLKIVYSPIHGTGITLVPPLLERWGFDQIHIVREQAQPDGNFPTVRNPNPEEEEAMQLSIQAGERLQADIILATDPDADRVGVAIKSKSLGNKYRLLNGNQIGSLLVDYVLKTHQDRGSLQPDDYVVKTIVTTGLIHDIAAHYGVVCHDVLTGFKFIGELMTAVEDTDRFLVGGEESYGYLIGDAVRDKDAIISCAIIAEMTAYYKHQDQTLEDALHDIYLRHGYYLEKLISLTKTGKKGADEIEAIMKNLRTDPPLAIEGIKFKQINDYLNRTVTDLQTSKVTPIELPASNVLQFWTEEGDIISVRPSGTEPKIKFYCSVRTDISDLHDLDKIEMTQEQKIQKLMDGLIR